MKDTSIVEAVLNVEIRANAYPETFRIPPRDQRDSLFRGDFAKLAFVVDDKEIACERMWVEVIKRIRGGAYLGRLRNDPAILDRLRFGALVRFGPEHVLDIDAPLGQMQ